MSDHRSPGPHAGAPEWKDRTARPGESSTGDATRSASLASTTPTQRQRVEARLRRGWTCGVEFLDMRILRYTARIFELRNDGIVVQRRPCQSHPHDAAMWEWRIPPEIDIEFDEAGQGRIGGLT